MSPHYYVKARPSHFMLIKIVVQIHNRDGTMEGRNKMAAWDLNNKDDIMVKMAEIWRETGNKADIMINKLHNGGKA